MQSYVVTMPRAAPTTRPTHSLTQLQVALSRIASQPRPLVRSHSVDTCSVSSVSNSDIDGTEPVSKRLETGVSSVHNGRGRWKGGPRRVGKTMKPPGKPTRAYFLTLAGKTVSVCLSVRRLWRYCMMITVCRSANPLLCGTAYPQTRCAHTHTHEDPLTGYQARPPTYVALQLVMHRAYQVQVNGSSRCPFFA